MVSDNVPEKYRNFFALHEKLCVPNIGKECHCKNATEIEL
jgi:hypothetical protein